MPSSIAPRVEKNGSELIVRKIILQEYHIEEKGTNHSRTATIFIKDGKFDQCKYDVGRQNTFYSLEDWKFIHALAAKILELGDKP